MCQLSLPLCCFLPLADTVIIVLELELSAYPGVVVEGRKKQ